jgi:hypothetical protein
LQQCQLATRYSLLVVLLLTEAAKATSCQQRAPREPSRSFR